MAKIRDFRQSEYAFLREMLFEAVFVPRGEEKPSDAVLGPLIQKYVAHFGRSGDHALVLEDEEGLVGAIWVRQFDHDERGYGFVDDITPELGIPIVERFRGRGYGTHMIEAICDKLRQFGIAKVSLSVDKRNPAVRLYERCDFTIVDEAGKGYTRLKQL